MAIRRNNNNFKGRGKSNNRRDERPAGSSSYFKKKDSDDSERPRRKDFSQKGDRTGPGSAPFKRKKPFEAGEEKPFHKRSEGTRDGGREERSSSERPSSYRGKRATGDRAERPFRKNTGGFGDGERRERSSGRPTSFRGKRDSNDREERPFRKNTGSFGDGERRERPSSGRPSSFRGKRAAGDREERPFRKNTERFGDGDKPGRTFDRPSAYKSKKDFYGDSEGKSFKKTTDKKFSNETGTGEFAERRSYERKSFSKKRNKESKTDDGLIRLNKYISNSGICSRREADEFITAGLVTVNGEVVTTLGTKVKPTDDIRYNGTRMKNERMVYVLLNKPKDYITTTDDPQQRKTVMELVASACKERIYPVGRLDRNTTGLLLFTNDGEMADKLTHPSTNIKKVYMVELNKNLKPGDMQTIAKGFELEDGFMQVDDIAFDEAANSKRIVGVTLHSGRNRIVRRIFEHLGYMVVKLDRTYYAGLTKRDLPRGRYRHLDEMEINMLKMIKGR